METRIQLCGRLVVRLSGADVTAALPAAQGRRLFAFLVLNRTREASRDELVDAVWAEQPPAEPAQALRSLLSKLRRALGSDCIEGHSGVRLALPPDAWIDTEAAAEAVHDAESAVAQSDHARAWAAAHIAINVGGRTFMAGHDADWISHERALLADLRLRGLEALAAAGVGLGGPELDTAERAARALVAEAPFRESGYALLMRALAARGNAAEALLAYDGLRTRLRDELGMAPSRPLQDLHAELIR